MCYNKVFFIRLSFVVKKVGDLWGFMQIKQECHKGQQKHNITKGMEDCPNWEKFKNLTEQM